MDKRVAMITGTVFAGVLAAGAIAAPVSYTHLRAHETPEHLVCRLLLEKNNTQLHRRLSHHTY